mmetsp:Transcript_26996/g.69567  ORF Transcript_26996/g.69567 Transcript_26996/m.69567 type:complete len:280 (+) Transcript_26996:746-1585(+)
MLLGKGTPCKECRELLRECSCCCCCCWAGAAGLFFLLALGRGAPISWLKAASKGSTSGSAACSGRGAGGFSSRSRLLRYESKKEAGCGGCELGGRGGLDGIPIFWSFVDAWLSCVGWSASPLWCSWSGAPSWRSCLVPLSMSLPPSLLPPKAVERASRWWLLSRSWWEPCTDTLLRRGECAWLCAATESAGLPLWFSCGGERPSLWPSLGNMPLPCCCSKCGEVLRMLLLSTGLRLCLSCGGCPPVRGDGPVVRWWLRSCPPDRGDGPVVRWWSGRAGV